MRRRGRVRAAMTEASSKRPHQNAAFASSSRDQVLLPLPSLQVDLDPTEKKREKRRFREISPLFSDFHRSIFDISSSRRIRTTENALFHELNTEHKRPKGLEPTTRFQILSVFCFRHKLFTNSPFQNRSIPSPKGIEPANFQKTIDKRRLL